MRSSILVAAAVLLMAAAGCSAEQQPAHSFGRGGRSIGAKGSKGSSAIAGVWQVEQVGEEKPAAYFTILVQGDAVALTGVHVADSSATTGTGWFVSPPRPSYKVDTYPTYKVLIGATSDWSGWWSGWWTLVVIDADTTLLYPHTSSNGITIDDPVIPNPPVQAPDQIVLKRVKNY